MNTGAPGGSVLTNSGTLTITEAGRVVNAMNMTGPINVNANDVTIQNSKIQGMTGTLYGIKVADGVTGTKVLHSEVSTVAGGYTGISMSSNPYRYTNIAIRNNRWIRDSYQFGTHSFDDPVTTGTGNVFDDNGRTIDP